MRGAILITLLSESLCGFNGLTFTAGTVSAVFRTDSMSVQSTHTCMHLKYMNASQTGQYTPGPQSIQLVALLRMGYQKTSDQQ